MFTSNPNPTRNELNAWMNPWASKMLIHRFHDFRSMIMIRIYIYSFETLLLSCTSWLWSCLPNNHYYANYCDSLNILGWMPSDSYGSWRFQIHDICVVFTVHSLATRSPMAKQFDLQVTIHRNRKHKKETASFDTIGYWIGLDSIELYSPWFYREKWQLKCLKLSLRLD